MLQELYETYRGQGFEVIGLAFEMTEDRDRNVRVLERFKKKHGLDYTILIAGSTTNKGKATEILGGIDQLLSYPTTLLINTKGEVVSIHTGFTGPGTGHYYDDLKKAYHEKIKALLAREGP